MNAHSLQDTLWCCPCSQAKWIYKHDQSRSFMQIREEPSMRKWNKTTSLMQSLQEQYSSARIKFYQWRSTYYQGRQADRPPVRTYHVALVSTAGDLSRSHLSDSNPYRKYRTADRPKNCMSNIGLVERTIIERN